MSERDNVEQVQAFYQAFERGGMAEGSWSAGRTGPLNYGNPD
jgi:hypothetical protein